VDGVVGLGWNHGTGKTEERRGRGEERRGKERRGKEEGEELTWSRMI